MSNIKELLEFPTIYTFKIIGYAENDFADRAKKIFTDKKDVVFVETPSNKGVYISLSVTATLEDYEELEEIYKAVSVLDGLKFYV